MAFGEPSMKVLRVNPASVKSKARSMTRDVPPWPPRPHLRFSSARAPENAGLAPMAGSGKTKPCLLL